MWRGGFLVREDKERKRTLGASLAGREWWCCRGCFARREALGLVVLIVVKLHSRGRVCAPVDLLRSAMSAMRLRQRGM